LAHAPIREGNKKTNADSLIEREHNLRHGNKSLREIRELFGGLDYAPVAQRIRRTRSAHSARARSNLISEMLNALLANNFGL
jgi:hypothetical protein